MDLYVFFFFKFFFIYVLNFLKIILDSYKSIRCLLLGRKAMTNMSKRMKSLYHPWGQKESDTTERLSQTLSVCMHAKSLQVCLTLCDPMDCSRPGSSVHGIFHARILEWVAISYSRVSSPPRGRTRVSCVSCIASRFFTCWVKEKRGIIKELKQEKFPAVKAGTQLESGQVYLLPIE